MLQTSSYKSVRFQQIKYLQMNFRMKLSILLMCCGFGCFKAAPSEKTIQSDDFPIDFYVRSVVRFLDALEYHDNNFTPQDRIDKLHYAYLKTARHFAQPYQQRHIKSKPKRLQALVQTIVAMVVYSWPVVSDDVMADLSIHFGYMLIYEEVCEDKAETLKSFYDNLLSGKLQENPWLRMVTDHLLHFLPNYGPYCGVNIIRSTADFFQGCWIEENKFFGFPGSYDYPNFLRRLNGLGHCVGASIFPKNQFDEEKLFGEITAAIAQIEHWMVFVNDVFSFYKEFNQPHDETILIKCYAECDETSLEQAMEKLTNVTIIETQQFTYVFHDKDPGIYDSIRKFLHGYVTWHLTDPRYRVQELYQSAGVENDKVVAKFRAYLRSAKKVGSVNETDWAYPTLTELIAEQQENTDNLTQK